MATITTPQFVLYCNACGMPPEYCAYGPDFETHCVPWLKSNHPRFFSKLHGNKAVSSAGGNDQEGDESNPAPTEPWTTRERLVAFYTKYMPEKLDGIDAILEKYEGKEDKLFKALVKKYGPEPEDPYYAAGSDSDDDEGGVAERMEGLDVAGGKGGKKKRRGAAAKKVNKVDTRVVVQKISRNRKKAVTHVVGMDTVPGIKLKEASKAFSKRFAGSSSVKDKEIIIQGDHLEDVAEMIVSKFGVSEDAVFLDLDGEFVPFGG
eukprot:CAMPEP_0172530478 /NCGR_PEP_ID=MMETSP1067-20121228/4204_1 /TAXON_ID=265564 ORGANISM="Thalassiosira punctigera, Strain Tpunct2005C2" /NCGR_SAMPLE_ID=MMETSP1067 /ASSEMBLY_ACC=CAM_ASM_000444 /LENGTH=261 /DNA_ID=CAMNT_0013314697 /DNA_START=104 /DNA_END=889 /DNA_ORIENTATION=+